MIEIMHAGQYVCTQDWLNWNPMAGLLEGIFELSGKNSTAGMEWLCQFRPEARAEFVFNEKYKRFHLPTGYAGLFCGGNLEALGARLREYNGETHHVLQNVPWDTVSLRHPIVTQILPTISDHGLDMLVNIAGASLHRMPDILLHLGLFHELLAKQAVQPVGYLNLVINRLASSREFIDQATPLNDELSLAASNPYDLSLNTYRIHNCGKTPTEVMNYARFFVEEETMLGVDWDLLKRVAGTFRKAQIEILGDDPERFDFAYEAVSKMVPCDWTTAALIWIERNAE